MTAIWNPQETIKLSWEACYGHWGRKGYCRVRAVQYIVCFIILCGGFGGGFKFGLLLKEVLVIWINQDMTN